MLVFFKRSASFSAVYGCHNLAPRLQQKNGRHSGKLNNCKVSSVGSVWVKMCCIGCCVVKTRRKNPKAKNTEVCGVRTTGKNWLLLCAHRARVCPMLLIILPIRSAKRERERESTTAGWQAQGPLQVKKNGSDLRWRMKDDCRSSKGVSGLLPRWMKRSKLQQRL